MHQLKNIVVGVDFSRFCQVALKQSIRLARWDNAKLHVIHVIDSEVVDDVQKSLDVEVEKFGEEVKANARERLDACLAECNPEGVDVEPVIAIGVPLTDILRLVRDTSADLLVLGMMGSSERAVGAGALATKCARRADAKVMLVRSAHAEPFKNVLACVDFSESSSPVVEQAVRIALQDKAQLHIMHAFYPPWKVLHYMAPTRQASPDYQKQYAQQLEDRLRMVAEPFQDDLKNLTVEFHLVESADMASGIVKFQESPGADLVVLGTRGRTGIKALLLGTTAEYVIRESTCSILAIKPADFHFDVE